MASQAMTEDKVCPYTTLDTVCVFHCPPLIALIQSLKM